MTVNPENLNKALDAIRQQYGESTVHRGVDSPPINRLTTGSVELDLATGGGIPLGRWTHAYGAFSSGKTLFSYRVIKAAQDKGMGCAYYNIENQFDADFARQQGVKVEDLLIVEGATIERVGTQLETLPGSVHLHVLDSLAAAVSVDELSAKVEDWHMGLAPRAWGKVFRRANERFSTDNAIIMINQVRDVFGYGGGEAPPGGRFIDFMSSMSLYFRKSSWLHRDGNGFLDPKASPDDSVSGDQEPAGIEFQVRVNKSRVCRPLRTARMRYDFSSGDYDNVWSLAKAATHFGVIKQTGKGWYQLDSGEKLHGTPAVRAALEADPQLQEKVVEAMRRAA